MLIRFRRLPHLCANIRELGNRILRDRGASRRVKQVDHHERITIAHSAVRKKFACRTKQVLRHLFYGGSVEAPQYLADITFNYFAVFRQRRPFKSLAEAVSYGGGLLFVLNKPWSTSG